MHRRKLSNSVTEMTVISRRTEPWGPFKFNVAGQVTSGPYICIIKSKSA